MLSFSYLPHFPKVRVNQSSFKQFNMFLVAGYSGTLEVKEVGRTSQNRKLFRQMARETSGETFEPPEENKLFFAYHNRDGIKTLIGVASYEPAEQDVASPPTDGSFESSFYHIVTFLFIKRRYQDQGYGTQTMEKMESDMMSQVKRPIRTQSAEKAVRFFEKMGFTVVAGPYESICGGSPLFRWLHYMEKPIR